MCNIYRPGLSVVTGFLQGSNTGRVDCTLSQVNFWLWKTSSFHGCFTLISIEQIMNRTSNSAPEQPVDRAQHHHHGGVHTVHVEQPSNTT